MDVLVKVCFSKCQQRDEKIPVLANIFRNLADIDKLIGGGSPWLLRHNGAVSDSNDVSHHVHTLELGSSEDWYLKNQIKWWPQNVTRGLKETYIVEIGAKNKHLCVLEFINDMYSPGICFHITLSVEVLGWFWKVVGGFV